MKSTDALSLTVVRHTFHKTKSLTFSWLISKDITVVTVHLWDCTSIPLGLKTKRIVKPSENSWKKWSPDPTFTLSTVGKSFNGCEIRHLKVRYVMFEDLIFWKRSMIFQMCSHLPLYGKKFFQQGASVENAFTKNLHFIDEALEFSQSDRKSQNEKRGCKQLEVFCICLQNLYFLFGKFLNASFVG